MFKLGGSDVYKGADEIQGASMDLYLKGMYQASEVTHPHFLNYSLRYMIVLVLILLSLALQD